MVTNDALNKAFQLLASTVQDFHSQARPCLGATLKPSLYSSGNFSEQMLGFRKFGDFLRAAETAGHVQLRATRGGDISVWPTTGPIPESQTQSEAITDSLVDSPARPTVSSGIRVRQDLWNAFNSFSAKWVYDPATDTAFRETEVAAAWNVPGAQRPNLVTIPVGRERVIGWMRSFANAQDSEISKQLLAALNGDAGPYRFNAELRSKGLLRPWSHFHIQQVVAAIDAWSSVSGVQPKNVTTPKYLPVRSPNLTPNAPVIPDTPQIAPPILRVDRPPTFQPSPLTGRLESLIDELIDELLRLRGLLQVVGVNRHS